MIRDEGTEQWHVEARLRAIHVCETGIKALRERYVSCNKYLWLLDREAIVVFVRDFKRLVLPIQ